jgi:hypothetical protein
MELVFENFVEQQHPHLTELVKITANDETIEEDMDRDVKLNYAKVCRILELQGLKDPKADARIQEMLDLGYLVRGPKLSEAEVKILQEKEYPEAAHFTYVETESSSAKGRKRTQGERYDNQKDRVV